MTLLHEAVEAKRFDTRIVERNIARSVLKPNELQTTMGALPDDSENAEWMSIEALAGEPGRDDSSDSFGPESASSLPTD